MSVSLVLVPLAVAAVAAWQAAQTGRDDNGRLVCSVTTRMRDPQLLAAALSATGARVEDEDDVITAAWQGVEAHFERDADGIWGAHLVGDVDEVRAISIITAVDAAYGKQVQQAVLTRLRQRAAASGMEIESESRQDDEVTVVLTVRAGA